MTDITDDFAQGDTQTGAAGPDPTQPTPDAAQDAPRARRPRRAASRPAGPPVAADEPAADAGSAAAADAGLVPGDDPTPADVTPEVTVDAAEPAPAPVKRAARKRAPRKTAAAAEPAVASTGPDGAPDTVAGPGTDTDGGPGPTAVEPAATVDEATAGGEPATDDAPPAPKARKRAPRKRAAAAQAPVVEPAADQLALDEPAGDQPAAVEPAVESAAVASAAVEPAVAEPAVADVAGAEPAVAGLGTDDAATAVAASDATSDAPSDGEPDTAAAEAARLLTAPLAMPVLFQAPDPTAAAPRRRRRASAPAGPPVHHDDVQPDVIGDLPDGALAAAPAVPDAPTVAGAPVSLDDTVSDTSDDTAAAVPGDDEPADETSGRKRRRRGGRGRRARAEDDATAETVDVDEPGAAGDDDTAAGETAADVPTSDDDETAGDGISDETDDTDDTEDDSGEEEGGSASSRRRRRRRRRSGSGSGDPEVGEDPPGTVTRVRAPRRPEDEVASVRGSTRLEAKKQRRRDGREAGRRKPGITEAEFLARRESVERTMVVRESAGRTQIAVMEDAVLVEHYVANETNASLIGNVYLGRVQNVLPSMEAAFVDIGKGRNAVLYAGEVNWDAAGMEGQPRRIEAALKSGDTVLVQVTKDPMGHKGARLTSQVSLPGRYLVYVPGSSMTGISRKLPDVERSRLKRILKEVVPEKAGVIVRTAAEGASEDELRQDVARLTAQWEDIERRAATVSGSAPKVLYGEPDLTIRVVRDVFNEDFSSLVVSGDGAWDVVQPYLTDVAPDLADRVTRWTSDRDVFAEHRIDEQLAKAMDRKVWLPSGGSLVIDRTEAMTVVDVNTGKFTGSGGNLEETVTRNNLEAAEEVVRQLRLRDIGGIIVVDFIDMVLEGNRDLVLRRLLECLGRDRTKHQVAEVTSLGLVQMTRKRVGQGLLEVFSEPCEHCHGRGVVISAEPVDRRGGSEPGSVGGNVAGAGGVGNGAGGGRGARGGNDAGSSRRGRGGRSGESAPVVAEAPVRQPIPAGFVASLAHHDDRPARLADPAVAPAPAAAPVVAASADVPAPVVDELDLVVESALEPPLVESELDAGPDTAAADGTGNGTGVVPDGAPNAPTGGDPLAEVAADVRALRQAVEAATGQLAADATPVDDAPAGRVDQPADEPIDDPEPAVRPARRRRRASAPSGPPRAAQAPPQG